MSGPRGFPSWLRHHRQMSRPEPVRPDVCDCERPRPAAVYLFGTLRLHDAFECQRCGRPVVITKAAPS